MRTVHFFLAVVFVCAMHSAPGFTQEKKPIAEKKLIEHIHLDGVICVVNAEKPTKPEFSIEHLRGFVFFSDAGARDRFVAARNKKSSEFLAEANFQLFVTKQYKQRACPLSGSELRFDGKEPDTKFPTIMRRQTVFVCCENCQTQIAGLATDNERVTALFRRKQFDFGFRHQSVIAGFLLGDTTCLVSGEKALQQWSVEFNNAKIYFANEEARKSYESKLSDYAVAAYWQLFDSGQFVQNACPFSGAETKAGLSVEVGKHEILFCCQNCVDQINEVAEQSKQTADSPTFGKEPAQTIQLLFNKRRFQLGFNKRR